MMEEHEEILPNQQEKISAEIDYVENFIKSEFEKGERICKKTEEELFNCIERSDFVDVLGNERGNPSFENYTSGRRVKPFDEWGCFVEVATKDGNALVIEFGGIKQMAFMILKFSTEEIESYAKSHRFFEDINHGLPRFVRVFEFKPGKI